MANKDYKPVTAQAAVVDEAKVDREAAERAEKAGVASASRVDYEKAMDNYQNREDVEHANSRFAREGGASLRTKQTVTTKDVETPNKDKS